MQNCLPLYSVTLEAYAFATCARCATTTLVSRDKAAAAIESTRRPGKATRELIFKSIMAWQSLIRYAAENAQGRGLSAKEVKNGEAVETVYEPRSPEQLQKLENLIRNAVGIDNERNDQFSLVNIPFETKPNTELIEASPTWYENSDGMINIIIVVIAIGGALFLLKGLLSKLKTEKLMFGGTPSELALQPSTDTAKILSKSVPKVLTEAKKKKDLIQIGDIEDEISDEAIRKRTRQDKISNYVSKSPNEAAKLINAWLHEDEA